MAPSLPAAQGGCSGGKPAGCSCAIHQEQALEENRTSMHFGPGREVTIEEALVEHIGGALYRVQSRTDTTGREAVNIIDRNTEAHSQPARRCCCGLPNDLSHRAFQILRAMKQHGLEKSPQMLRRTEYLLLDVLCHGFRVAVCLQVLLRQGSDLARNAERSAGREESDQALFDIPIPRCRVDHSHTALMRGGQD